MSISGIEIEIPAAKSVGTNSTRLTVDLADGRTISVPLDWYPRLLHAAEAERANWRLIGNGEGIHWPDLDEDISVEGLIGGFPSGECDESFERWLKSR